MASVHDVAAFFVDMAINNEDDHMTNLKLNKLIYYAQGCHLSRTGTSLFHEAIEAWPYGPVIAEVYHRYKEFGSLPISRVKTSYSSSVFSSVELETLVDVMREMGCYTGFALVNKTHALDAPWDKARKSGKDVINLTDIRDYFCKHPIPRFSFDGVPTVSELPADWYDPSEDAEWEAYL